MKTVLVIDDEDSIRSLYKEELEDDGYDVLTAETGKKALDILDENDVDIITLDIRMPEMDGLEFLGEVRKKNKEIPIIVCSAFSSYKQDFSVWGADAYVVKSSDLTELKNCIKQFV